MISTLKRKFGIHTQYIYCIYVYIYLVCLFYCFYIQTEMSIMCFKNKLIKYRNIIAECRDSSKSILFWFLLVLPRGVSLLWIEALFSSRSITTSAALPQEIQRYSVFKQAVFKCCLFLMHGGKVLH